MSADAFPMSHNLKKKVAMAFVWSALQGWSIKFLALLLFFVLARYLSPEEMGLAQAVTLVLAFIALISEQGFHRALVQRHALRAVDVNLPFFLSVGVALIASFCMWIFSENVARFLGENKSAGLIRMAAVIPPVTAATGILVAMFRREMDFRSIAQGSFVASVISGVVSLVFAVRGHGALSLVIQAIVSVGVTALMMWRRPVWRPRFRIDMTHFRGILSYSSMSFASQIIDFFSRRLIDFIILSRYGLAALGVYTVGAKLYITILELLTAALMEVTHSALSRMSTDVMRLRQAYLRLLFIASCTSLPLFLLISALAPELCALLFGEKWGEAAVVTRLLCALGAVEVVQFFNGAVLGAAGNARAVLYINIARLVSGVGALAIFQTASVGSLTSIFILSQLLVFPFSFAAAMRATHSRSGDVVTQIIPGLLAAAVAFGVVLVLRNSMLEEFINVVSRSLALGAIFCGLFLLIIVFLCKERLIAEFRYIRNSYRN